MHLPEILEAWGEVNRLHGFRFATFAGAVIHDRNPGMEGVYEHLGVRAGLSMMQPQ